MVFPIELSKSVRWLSREGREGSTLCPIVSEMAQSEFLLSPSGPNSKYIKLNKVTQPALTAVQAHGSCLGKRKKSSRRTWDGAVCGAPPPESKLRAWPWKIPTRRRLCLLTRMKSGFLVSKNVPKMLQQLGKR